MDYLVAFDSTHQAMEMEAWIKAREIKARLIPTPESITASCGLALKFSEIDLADIVTYLSKISHQEISIYRLEIDEHHHKTYTPFLGGAVDE